MKEFTGKIAVITGGGTGMGRALARQLVAEGCSIATCDILEDNLAETRRLCEREAAQGRVVSAHRCDVSVEDEVLELRDAVRSAHNTDHIDLLFNNAGVAGGGSFVNGDRDEWERTLQHLLARRLPLRPRVHAHAGRKFRGAHDQHEQRQRLLGDTWPP